MLQVRYILTAHINLYRKERLGLFFYVVGLHYRPHFDFGKSKKKEKSHKSQRLLAGHDKIVPCVVFIKQ